MMRMLLYGTLMLGLLVSPARGDPFFLRYDADETFPEQEGWTRYWDDPDGQEVRTVEDGVLRLDTRRSYSIFDFCYVRSDAFDLDPGEELRISWRMQTFETDTWDDFSDVALGITNGDAQYVKFFLTPGFVSRDEGGSPEIDLLFEYEPGVPHTFLFRTSDMESYELFVDGEPAFQGQFARYAMIGEYAQWWGDTVTGRTSLSEWDYVEVAVVPEPATIGLALLSCAVMGRNIGRTAV